MSCDFARGCYDMVHFGHTNFFRKCKEESGASHLIVSNEPDLHVIWYKRQPVFNEDERKQLLKAVKWVDEVIVGPPVRTSPELLDEIGADFCVHGDDVVLLADGTDPNQLIKATGRYKELERTRGISTTDLIGRILRQTDESSMSKEEYLDCPSSNGLPSRSDEAVLPWTVSSSFLPTTRLIRQFSGTREPGPQDRIVYAPGAFDLFHPGHLDFLEAAAALGDYLIVGLHTDQTVHVTKGSNRPIMNLQERTLGCLAYRCVDEVIIGAPYLVTKALMETFKVDVVCHGSQSPSAELEGRDPYSEPKRQGKFRLLDSGNLLTTKAIIQRVLDRREEYKKGNTTPNGKGRLEWDVSS